MTDIYATPDDLGDLRTSELHSSLGERLGAQAGEAFMGGTRTLGRLFEYSAASGIAPLTSEAATNDPDLAAELERQRQAIPDTSIDDARTRVKQEGLDRHLTLPDQPAIKTPVLELMLQHARERREYEAAVTRGPQGLGVDALGFITEIGAGIIDPVNAAAFSIPVLGEARLGMIKAGESIAGRAGYRAIQGAAQGAVGGAALVPADWWLHSLDGQDYTYADALRSVILSAGMGGVAHAAVGAMGDLAARRRGLPLPGSPEDLVGQALTPRPEAPGEAVERPVPAEAPEGGPSTEAVQPPAAAPAPLHPAEILADLPPRVQEDVVRSAIADVVAGRPVRAGELLAEAAKEDPRIAESVHGVAQPEAPAAGLPPIDATHDVVSGANSSKDPNGPVYIDRRIPQFSPKLTDGQGRPLDLWKYLAIHETEEAKAMAGGMSYERAHEDVATPAERAALEADGGDWKAYTHEIDGYLAHIENEKAANPPADTHVDPQAAIGHHRSSNKASDEGNVIHVRPGKPRGPRARPEETWSLLEFLADRGGIDPTDPLIADLRTVLGGQNKFVPGFGNVIRKGGMRLDKAREVAVEAGYIFDIGHITDAQATSTIDTLLQAVDQEAQRKQRVYRHGRQDAPAERDEGQYRHELESALDHAIEQSGGDPAHITGRLRDRVLEIMDREGVRDPVDALERAVMEEDLRGVEAGELEPNPEKIPGWDAPDDTGGAPGAGAAGAGERPAAGGPARAGGGDAGPAGRPAARGVADWQRLAEARDPINDPDAVAESKAAERVPEPESTDPAKAPSAAEKAAAEADELLADILPRLSDEERRAFEDALAKLDQEHEARAQVVKEGAACLAAAVA